MNDSELMELMELCEKASPGPWSACQDGNCKCKTVGFADGPVAKVECGEWGDEYCALRVVPDKEHRRGLTGTSLLIEAYMERIPYGVINEETAQANAQLIAAAREAIQRLIAERDRARTVAGELAAYVKQIMRMHCKAAGNVRAYVWHVGARDAWLRIRPGVRKWLEGK